MKLNTIWYCYTSLCIVIFHTIVASPVALQQNSRSIEAVDVSSAALDLPATLDEDVFGQNSHHGGEKDKRLIKPFKAIKTGLKAGAVGVGLKAATKIGKVGVKAAATLGIKALIINLLFGLLGNGSSGGNTGNRVEAPSTEVNTIEEQTPFTTPYPSDFSSSSSEYTSSPGSFTSDSAFSTPIEFSSSESSFTTPSSTTNFKTRLLTQLDQQNRLKNAQYLGIGLPEHKPIPATNPVNQSPYIQPIPHPTLSPDQVQITPAGYGSSELPNINVRGLDTE